MAGIDAFSTAAQLRDTIVTIAESVIKRMRPDDRIGQIVSINREQYQAEVRFAGDEGTLKVRFTPSQIPKSEGVIVRVAGKPGDYYIQSILNDTTINDEYEPTKDDAAAALVAALAAETSAENAVVAANGKNRNYYFNSTLPPGSNYIVGDLAFDRDDGYKIYQWDGDSWEPYEFGEGALANGAVISRVIDTGAVTADKLQSILVIANRFIAGTLNARRLELNSSGITLYDKNNDPTIQLTHTLPNFLSFYKNDEAQITLTEDGVGNFKELNTDSLNVDGESLNDINDRFPAGLVGYGKITPQNASNLPANTWHPIAEISLSLKADREYLFLWNQHWDTTETDSGFEVQLHNGGSSRPNLNSPVILHRHMASYVSRHKEPLIHKLWDVSTSGTYRLLISVKGTKTITVNQSLEFLAFDLGPYMPQVMVDRSAGGGSGGTGSSNDVKTYTKTYTANWSQTWNGYGNKISGKPTQGYYSSTNGNQRALIGFPESTIQNDLNGSESIEKVELYLYSDHWYYNSGGTAVIGFHQNNSEPANFQANTNVLQTHMEKPGGKWINITSFSKNDWKTGAKTGVSVGPGPTTSKTYYGSFHGHTNSKPPKLRITYKK